MMTKEEVLRHLCQTTALVYRSIGDYRFPSDGFCDECPFANEPGAYKHSGETLEYIRRAVVFQLKTDGYRIAEGFDPVTGNQLEEQANASVEEQAKDRTDEETVKCQEARTETATVEGPRG